MEEESCIIQLLNAKELNIVLDFSTLIIDQKSINENLTLNVLDNVTEYHVLASLVIIYEAPTWTCSRIHNMQC